MRARKPIWNSASMTAGWISADSHGQSPCEIGVYPAGGSQPSVTLKRMTDRMPSQKLGNGYADQRRHHHQRIDPAVAPIGGEHAERDSGRNRDRHRHKASDSVTGSRSTTALRTLWLRISDLPKSPCARWPSQAAVVRAADDRGQADGGSARPPRASLRCRRSRPPDRRAADEAGRTPGRRKMTTTGMACNSRNATPRSICDSVK